MVWRLCLAEGSKPHKLTVISAADIRLIVPSNQLSMCVSWLAVQDDTSACVLRVLRHLVEPELVGQGQTRCRDP
jgi:hypothetical protein